MSDSTKITRIILHNYKSLRDCDVVLGPITFLVGPNGAGKSNFLEALRFVSFALSTSLEQALDTLSGFRSVLHKGSGTEDRISFEMFFRLREGETGSYLVEIGSALDGPVSVIREECSIESPLDKRWFKVDRGVVSSNQGVMPVAAEGKLYLVNASGLPAFEPVYRLLSNIAVYNPVPDDIRGFKPEKKYRHLDRKGSGLAEIVFRLNKSAPERLTRVTEYLRRINPSVLEVSAATLDANYNLHIYMEGADAVRDIFSSQNTSDGTLRALAILVALFQDRERAPLSLTGLEEPEAGLHPAAAGVLFDSLMEASKFGQIIVTSHSPDLLDREDLPADAIQAVAFCDGRTIIGPVNSAGRSVLRERLYTVGELMRMDQLQPEGLPDCADAR